MQTKIINLKPPIELLQLAQQTNLGQRQLRTLSEALHPTHDLEAIAAELPATAIEAFVIAAWLAGAPLELSSVSHFLPRLADPASLTRIVSLTTGNRLTVLRALRDEGELDKFQFALLLFLCVESYGPEAKMTRLADRLCDALYLKTCWAGMVLLGEASMRMWGSKEDEFTAEAMSFARSEQGIRLVNDLRGIFQEPFSTLPSDGRDRSAPGERVRRMEYLGHPLCTLTRDGYLAESWSEAIAYDLSELDARSLFAMHHHFEGLQNWDAAARALDEMVSKEENVEQRIEYLDTLIRAGQAKRAQQQVELIRAAGDEPDAEVLFELALLDEDSTLQKLNSRTHRGLVYGKHDELLRVAELLLDHAPEIGVLYARGALAEVPALDRTYLADSLCHTRDDLGLREENPAEHLLASLWRLMRKRHDID